MHKPAQTLLIFFYYYDMLRMALSINGKRLVSLMKDRGRFSVPCFNGKGGCFMVTYPDLIQIGILIVSIISLFFQVNNKKK